MNPSKQVPSENSPNSRIALIGDCPTPPDLIKGRPFIGPAGKVLDRLLGAANIARGDCYILNVVAEVPEKTNIENFITFEKPLKGSKLKHIEGTKGGAWVTEDYLLYEDRLLEQINNSSADIVIPLGNVALFALTRRNSITSWRGSILFDDRVPGKKIIPTAHPSATYKQYLLEYLILADFTRAKSELENPEGPPERKYRLNPSFAESMWYIEECLKHKLVGFDIETKRTRKEEDFTDWEVSCFSLAFDAKDVICIPLVDERGNNYFSLQQEIELWLKMQELLENPDVIKVGQNLMFDGSFILRKYGIKLWPVEDTMVATGILTPDFMKGLDFLTSLYTKEPYYKEDGKQHIKSDTSSNRFWLYSAKDSAVLLEIWDALEKELIAQGNLETYQRQRDVMRALFFMQEYGISCDFKARKEASEAIKRAIEAEQLKLNRLCGKELNYNSPKQLQQYFYGEKAIRPYINRKTKNTSVDEEALKKIAAKGFEEASVILRMREYGKLNGTYMEMTLDEDGRIRSAFNPVGTKTGRLSSRKTIFGTGGNVQNLPPEYKRYLCADAGFLIYVLDLKQAEPRIVANVAPDYNMLEAFENNIDLHSLTGSKLSGLCIEEVTEMNDLFEKTKDKKYCSPLGVGNKTWRYWGKRANNGLNYDLGVNTFAEQLEISKTDSKTIIDKYHMGYPGVRMYHAWLQDQLRMDRTITNCMGRKRKFLNRWGDDLFKEVYAQIPQSTVADIINERGLIPIEKNQDLYHHVYLLDQVHDSVVFQMPLDIGFLAHAAILLSIIRSLEQPVKWKMKEFVIPTDVKIGFNFGKVYEIKTRESLDAIAVELEETYKKLL